MRLQELSKGDHILWINLKGLYNHHVLVEVNDGVNTLRVVHYSGITFIVIREDIPYSDPRLAYGTLYHIAYHAEVERENPPELVLKRALSRLGESRYSLFYNNCESFATFCKRGVVYSHQVTDRLKHTIELFLTIALFLVWLPTCLEPERVDLFTTIMSAVHLNTVIVSLYCIVELVLCFNDIFRTYEYRDSLYLDEKSFNDAVFERIVLSISRWVVRTTASMGCGTVGASVGALLGSLLLVGIGTVVGSLLGSLLGALVSSYWFTRHIRTFLSCSLVT